MAARFEVASTLTDRDPWLDGISPPTVSCLDSDAVTFITAPAWIVLGLPGRDAQHCAVAAIS